MVAWLMERLRGFQLRLKARLIFTRQINQEAGTRLALFHPPPCTSYPMADRARRDRRAKSDKFAAFRLARQGGRREWKVRSSRIIRVG